MSYPKQIADIAQEIATRAQSHATALKRDLLEAQAHIREIEAQLHTADLAHKRFDSFVPIRGIDLQCPRCWINNETLANLRPIGGDGGHADNFRCNVCEEIFTLSL